MAFIRSFQASDEDAIVHIFRETAAADLVNDPNPETLHIASFLWARPYIRLRPEWSTVIDDGHGIAVGYILCAPDTASFVDDYRNQFIPYAASQGIDKPSEEVKSSETLPTKLQRIVYDPENMLHSKTPNLLNNYPAHLHIDILPQYQSGGFGQKLIEGLLKKLNDAKISGIHLGMVADNVRAGRFYSKLGFQPFVDMHDDGQSGKEGNAIYMVKKIENED